MLFGPSGSCSIVWAQQDSTKLSLSELKQTAGLLIELQKKREQKSIWADKEAFYKSMLENYDRIDERYQRQIKNLKLNLEAVTPAWYDHFWFGAAVTGIIVSSIYFMVK